MKLSVPDAARIIYGVRVAVGAVGGEIVEGDVVEPPKTFDELTSDEKETLFAEINASRQAGAEMDDVVGAAIERALR